jgi:hypothetical protein
MAKPKLHALNTDERLLCDGKDVTVNCGVTLRKAKQAFAWDEIVIGEMVSQWPTGMCRQCANLSDRQRGGRHYVYAMVSDQVSE